MGNSPPPSQPASKAPAIKRHYLNKENSIQYSETPIVQNFILVWLDPNANTPSEDHNYSITQLKQIVNSVDCFTDTDLCYDFIGKIKNEQIFLIVSGGLGKIFVPRVHNNVRVDSIYVFCGEPSAHTWTKKWEKITRVTNQIEEICKKLAEDAVQCDHDLSPTSILSMNGSRDQHLDVVNASFMSSKLVKDIILEMNYKPQAIQLLAVFCRAAFHDNKKELKMIDEFERDYYKHSSIWWYTRDSFIYKMLNRSLRNVDVSIIAAMGFFMRDLLGEIERLHSQQRGQMTNFIVYRGQRLLRDEFDGAYSNVGHLLCFNNFLSTSRKKDVAMKFVREPSSDKVRVLFEMEIDPQVISTPFAAVDTVSFYEDTEHEILFSMHTVFRILSATEDCNHLWTIKLKAVSADNLEITRLTEQMRRELKEGNAVERLGQLLIILGELEKAQLIYKLVETNAANDERTLLRVYKKLGDIKSKQDQTNEAEAYYKKAQTIQQKLL